VTQPSDAERLWILAAEVVRGQVSEAVWLSSFAEVVPSRPDGVGPDDTFATLVLAVPSPWVKERIEGRYLDLVHCALADVGAPETAVVVEIRPLAASGDGDGTAVTGADGNGGSGGGQLFPLDELRGRDPSTGRAGLPAAGSDNLLNPKYTFDAFVIGSSNRFAHAAALAVAERPALAYNPLFIYGDAGLGKTHLLQAAAHFVRENYSDLRIRYVSSEAFLNDYVESIRNRTGDAFRKRYRSTVDVLLVDDIQFLEGKEGFQEEFFHTFNALYESSRQIVMTSDRPPDNIATLEDRLRSRFRWGLITDIQPPDLETRIAILRKKAERETTSMPHDVLEFIATHITDNIRELEGALTRVAAFATLTKEPLSVELARRVLADLLTERQPRPITPVLVLDATSKLFSFSVEDIIGRARTRDLVDARHIAMYVCRQLTNPPLSYPQIARAFGGRDHTTVMNAVQRIERDMKERHKTFDRVEQLSAVVRKGE
jgi:chromosomal replication initiator protein